ncbi:hypothetical protein F5B22DRAFT_647233 [Xylaria bambusicola]|uniref:uncharacterized protein n=1 Tax=Xylaria bambusicola TaxID=326684 RepID=UPI002008293C|nr:uncharacterized protein F5B22DRAFT_647233 [Xylaria bambusicola]KAI0514755.1 hypothetical protein F5B22DRAFT_647233 [Xylaria bambusicola]
MESIPPVSADLTETMQPNLYASSTVPYTIALTCTALRLWCRWMNRAGLWLDDWLILIALASATGLSADLLWWIPRGLGKHVQAFGPEVQEDWAIGLFTAELTYTGVIVFVKFSILALYWRIFNKNSSIRLPIAILTGTVAAWGIAVFLLTVLQCIPIRGFWDKTINASCNVDSHTFLFAISIPNILTDAILLVLPVPHVVKLHASKSQKRGLITMFLLGGFVCIASILRLVAVLTQPTGPDFTWNANNVAVWAVVEADFAIISACLPTLRPFWLAIRPKQLLTAQSVPLSSDPSSKSRYDSRAPQAWGASVLECTVFGGQDDRPSAGSNSTGIVRDNLRHGLTPNSRQSKTTIQVPLVGIESQNDKAHRGIRVQSSWKVEYA